jgi:hypothetical protein
MNTQPPPVLRVPPGPHVVFSSQRKAEAFQDAVNAASGYPSRGVYASAVEAAAGRPVHRVGFGFPPHMKPDEGWTWCHQQIVQHPHQGLFAHSLDAHVQKLARAGRVTYPRTRVKQLSDDWCGCIALPYASSAAEAVLRRFLFSAPHIATHRQGVEIRISPGFLSLPGMRAIVANPGEALDLGPRDFERFVGDVLVARPFTAVMLGAYTKDGGADLVVATLTDGGPVITLVQCKRYDRDKVVGEVAAKSLLADVFRHNATAGLLVTSSRFTLGARRLRGQFMWRIHLWSASDLLTRFEDPALVETALAVGRPYAGLPLARA